MAYSVWTRTVTGLGSALPQAEDARGSWPADGKPRFVVARTNGMLDMPMSRGGNSDSARNTRLQATFAVLDRAFCHRAVKCFRTEDYRTLAGSGRTHLRGGLSIARCIEYAERDATTLADNLNEERAVAA